MNVACDYEAPMQMLTAEKYIVHCIIMLLCHFPLGPFELSGDISFGRAYKKAIMKSVVVRSAMSICQSLLLIIQKVMSPIIFSHPCMCFESKKLVGEYAGSMRTRASSVAETIRVNGEVLEYQIQGNQRCYCAVHTRQ